MREGDSELYGWQPGSHRNYNVQTSTTTFLDSIFRFWYTNDSRDSFLFTLKMNKNRYLNTNSNIQNSIEPETERVLEKRRRIRTKGRYEMFSNYAAHSFELLYEHKKTMAVFFLL